MGVFTFNAPERIIQRGLTLSFMDLAELESYKTQLATVAARYAENPNDASLKKLHDDLVDLISLSESLLPSSSKSSAPSKPFPSRSGLAAPPPVAPITITQSNPTLAQLHHKVGEIILAKWSGDGRWYPAKVTSVGGSDIDRVYGVVFKGYEDVEIIKHADTQKKVDRVDKSQGGRSGATAPVDTGDSGRDAIVKRGNGDASLVEKTTGEVKKRKKEKKESEAVVKQRAWLDFASGKTLKRPAVGTGKSVPVLQKKSIFATTQGGRVGVTGSGKPMTEPVGERKRVIKPTDEYVEEDR